MLNTAKNIRSLVPLGIGFLILLLSALGAFSFTQQREESFQEVANGLELESQLNSIQTLVTDAETGQRGYLLTGRIAYLDPFQLARQRLVPELDNLDRLAGGDQEQRERVKRLRAVIADKQAELQETIDLRGNNRADEALAIVNNDSGAKVMAEIRSIISDMSNASRQTMHTNRERAAGLHLNSQLILVFSVVLVVILGLFALRDTLGRIRDLQRTNTSLQSEITERKAAETQLRQLQKMEAIGQLTGGVAHDFNNMLAIIFGSLNLALKRLKTADITAGIKFIDNAMEGAQRAATLTSRLLAFSRQQPLDPRVLDTNQLVQGMSVLLSRTLGEHIKIETILGGGLWRVSADPAQIENAIINLAVNSRDAMPNGGKLTIETANSELDSAYARKHNEVTPGHYVVIVVTDTGGGMAPRVIERAFDPFFTTKTAGRGTGLGLSQVFGFVKQSKGHVKIYSEEGHGTSVKIYLPRYVGTGATEDLGPASEAMPQGDVKEVILVVEDDDAVRTITVSSLRASWATP